MTANFSVRGLPGLSRDGIIVVDLERRRVIDLLSDRTAETRSAWLRERPGITVVARDRSTEYARAIGEALPEAVQVAEVAGTCCTTSARCSNGFSAAPGLA